MWPFGGHATRRVAAIEVAVHIRTRATTRPAAPTIRKIEPSSMNRRVPSDPVGALGARVVVVVDVDGTVVDVLDVEVLVELVDVLDVDVLVDVVEVELVVEVGGTP